MIDRIRGCSATVAASLALSLVPTAVPVPPPAAVPAPAPVPPPAGVAAPPAGSGLGAAGPGYRRATAWWEAVVIAQHPACGWLTPVAAAVVDPFRPPGHPYGPGNRGIEYGTAVGDRVVAVAAGRVAFLGPVGGRQYLVVGHDGGLRSTYGPVLEVAVVLGQVVVAGEPVAEADEGFHLTARLDDRYLDPQPLLDGRCLRPRLVPPPDEPVSS